MDALISTKTNTTVSVSTSGNGSAITTDSLLQAALSLDSGSLFVLLTTLLVFFGPLFMLFPPFPPSKSDALTETHNKLGPEPLVATTIAGRITAFVLSLLSKPAAARDNSNGSGSVTSLAVYPIASCRGVSLVRSKVTPLGLEFDRLFTFAQLKSPFPLSTSSSPDGKDAVASAETSTALAVASVQHHQWESITRHQFPQLAQLEVELWQPDLAKIKGFRDPIAGSSRETFLIVRFPWRSEGLIAGLWDVFAAKCSQGWRTQPAIEIMLPVELPNEAESSAKGYAFEELRLRRGKDAESNDQDAKEGNAEVVTALNMEADLPQELRWFLGVSNKLALFRVDRKDIAKVAKEAGQESYPIKVTTLAAAHKAEEGQSAKAGNPQDFTLDESEAHIFVSGLSAQEEVNWDTIQLRPTDEQVQLDETEFQIRRTTTSSQQPDSGSKRQAMRMAPIFKNKQNQENIIEVGMSLEVISRGKRAQ
ncbi:hypothetical protein BD289DRAFT_478192 [Coniella lustricola]|uniref:Molybdenum cofactor sulfurase middle domain-containing protein n=1 Tax=Coniella lustricola TaxID=2025994 RepID=A0A2T3ANU7_9PEZI|nr:hypothetical protein BD289DRAFT_478192 [Coniella lustricola]